MLVVVVLQLTTPASVGCSLFIWSNDTSMITVLSESVSEDGKPRANIPMRRALWDSLKPQVSSVSLVNFSPLFSSPYLL